MRKLAIAASLLASVAFGSSAQAAITVYTTQADYLAAINNAGVDTYNDLNPVNQLPSSLNRTAGSHSYQVTTSGVSSLFAVGSTSDAWLSVNNTLDSLIYSGFSSGVSALGGFFFGTDLNGQFTAAPLGLTVSATDASGTVTRTLLNPTTSTFLGFVSTGDMSQLSVGSTVTGQSYWPTVNDLTLGTTGAVPEPASWAMMILGMGAIGLAMRRRNQVNMTVTYA